MPRKPSHLSIVRDLRQRLGLTQAQLAARLVVKPVTIKKIENDDLDISRRLAVALGGLTGISYQDIMANKRAVLNKTPPTKSIDQWDKEALALSDERLRLFQSRVCSGVGDLLQAARDHAPTKLVSLIAALYSGLDDLAEEFGLEKAVERVQKKPPLMIEFNCPICGNLFVAEVDWLFRVLEFGPVTFECPKGHRLEFRRSHGASTKGQSARKRLRQPL